MEDTLPPQGSRAWACGVPTAPAVASSGGHLSPEGLLPASLRSRGRREAKAAFKEGVVTEHRPALHLPGKRQRQASPSSPPRPFRQSLNVLAALRIPVSLLEQGEVETEA